MHTLHSYRDDSTGAGPEPTAGPIRSDNLITLSDREARRVLQARAAITAGVYDGPEYTDAIADQIVGGQLGSVADARRRGTRAAADNQPLSACPYGEDLPDLVEAWTDGYWDHIHTAMAEV